MIQILRRMSLIAYTFPFCFKNLQRQHYFPVVSTVVSSNNSKIFALSLLSVFTTLGEEISRERYLRFNVFVPTAISTHTVDLSFSKGKKGFCTYRNCRSFCRSCGRENIIITIYSNFKCLAITLILYYNSK